MADSNHTSSNLLAQTANPQRVLPEPSCVSSRELAVSRRDLLSFRTNHAVTSFSSPA